MKTGTTVFTVHNKLTGNNFGTSGTIALGRSLFTNTTLTDLNMSCKYKVTHSHPITNHSIFNKSTDSRIGSSEITPLFESLEVNTTLRKLDLSCSLLFTYNKLND